jgi:DNA-binding beta-propeller fold protein YncE
MKALLPLAFTTLLATLAAGAPAVFQEKPVATRSGDGAKIRFSLAASNDVEVAIVSGAAVVRHLAAGLLGGAKPPPPPLREGLAQELVWDGKDDFGRPAAGGPFQVRVRAGMTPAFDGFVGASPYAFASVRGLATDKEGNLFVLEQAYDGHFPGPYDIRVFSRGGTYLRTIMPFAATMKKADAAAFEAIDTGRDALMPRNQYSVWPCLIPFDTTHGLKLSATPTADGSLILHTESFQQIALVRMADGSTPDGKFLHPLWPAGTKLPWYDRGGSPVMALAPDGKTLYATAFAAAPKGEKLNPNWPENRVYRMAMDKIGQGLEKFADVELPDKRAPLDGGWMPASASSALRGVAVDAKGNVYVCNAAAGKVHKFDPSGKELGSVDAPSAHHAAVDPKSGVLYVLTCPSPGRDGEKKVIKFASGDTGAARVAELSLGSAGCSPFLTGDFTGSQPQLWVFGGSPAPSVLRVEDAGTELKIAENLRNRAVPTETLHAVDKLTVDPVTDDLYINDGWAGVVRINGLTGKTTGPEKDGKPEVLSLTDVAISPDGSIYVQRGPSYSGPIERLDRTLKPAPLANGKSVVGSVYARYGAGFCEKGLCVGWDGTVYVTGMYDWACYAIFAFGPDGQPMQGKCLVGGIKSKEAVSSGFTSAIAGPVYDRCGGLRIDREGNLYMGAQVFPEGFVPPPGFAKDEAYREMAGCVLKIKPGATLTEANRRSKSVQKFEGLVQAYPGLAPLSGWRRSDCCVCRTPRFDLDPYGRLYIPNAVTCSTRIVDNAGNVIAEFGAYGNFDSQWAAAGSTQKPIVNTPPIPMAWPIGAGTSEKKIYIADMMNRRVVRLDPNYAATETVAVK